jgi:hypothetical protein
MIPVANVPPWTCDLFPGGEWHPFLRHGGRYHEGPVKSYLDTLDIPIEVVIQKPPQGTAYALQCAESLLTENFLVLLGDTLD